MTNMAEATTADENVQFQTAGKQTTSGKKVSGRLVIFASAFGNALEFFDFGVYNFFVGYISVLFFPPSDAPPISTCCTHLPHLV